MHNTHTCAPPPSSVAAGYTGQETLDRVLRHPELEPIALGSDSLAGTAGPARSTRGLNGSTADVRSRTSRRLRSGADVIFLCLGNEQAAAFEPPDGDTVVIDLGGAHRLADQALARAVVRR